MAQDACLLSHVYDRRFRIKPAPEPTRGSVIRDCSLQFFGDDHDK
jgi:hypothetical protein